VIVTVGLALIGIAAVSWWFTRRRHPPAADAPHVQPVDDGCFRILVVAAASLCPAGGVGRLIEANPAFV